jgi:hypothetical protein
MWYEFIFPICDFIKIITSDSETELDILGISVKKPFYLGLNTFLLVAPVISHRSRMACKQQTRRQMSDIWDRYYPTSRWYFFLNSMGTGHSEEVCIFSKSFEASSMKLGYQYLDWEKRAMNFNV